MDIKHNTPERDEFRATDGAGIALWRWPHSKARPTLHWAHPRVPWPPAPSLTSLPRTSMSWPGTCGAWRQRRCGNVDVPGLEAYYRDMTLCWKPGRAGLACRPFHRCHHQHHGRCPPADKVLGLILAEPVIIDPMQGLEMGLAKLLRQSRQLSLAAGAHVGAGCHSHTAALDNYRGRGGFKTWPEAWLKPTSNTPSCRRKINFNWRAPEWRRYLPYRTQPLARYSSVAVPGYSTGGGTRVNLLTKGTKTPEGPAAFG